MERQRNYIELGEKIMDMLDDQDRNDCMNALGIALSYVLIREYNKNARGFALCLFYADVQSAIGCCETEINTSNTSVKEIL